MKEAIDAAGDFAPIVAVSLFALPSFIGLLRQTGFFKGLLMFISLGALSVGIDTLAIKSGIFYKEFSYAESLGGKLFGTTPWTIGLAYPPLLLAAFWLASKILKKRGRVLLTAVLLTFIGLIISPALAKLQLWKTVTAGRFYGVPLGNFAVWLAIGLVGGWLLYRLWGKDNQVRLSIAYSGLAILLFWTGVNIGVEQWIPVGTGVFASLVLLIVLILEKRQLRAERS